MPLHTWLRRDRLFPRFVLALRRVRRGGLASWPYWPLLVAVLSAAPYLSVWYDPTLTTQAFFGLLLLALATVWLMWLGRRRVGTWLAGAYLVLVLWAGMVFLWLMVENTWYHYAALALLVVTSWWYLAEWHHRQHNLEDGGEFTNATPALVVGFLATFGFGIGAVSLLVFLGTPLWQLVFATYLPVVLSFAALMVVSGWHLTRFWRYLVAAAVLLGETFVLVTWWPTSAYVIGFTLAAVYLALTLVLRQEAQGFFSRRSFARELTALALTLGVVLVTARWY